MLGTCEVLNDVNGDPNRFRYPGLVEELTGEKAPDCRIKDCRTVQELGVEVHVWGWSGCHWNGQIWNGLRKRLEYTLKDGEYQGYNIFLQTSEYLKHPLKNLTITDLADLSRTTTIF